MEINSKNLNFSCKLISETDLAELLSWKNKNRDRFHFKGIITPDMQATWYRSYLKRFKARKDFMYIVKYRDRSAGCIGFRLKDNYWDGYNIIRGNKIKGSEGIMSWAMSHIISNAFSISNLNFQVDVLNNNPAIDWYLKCGFEVLTQNKVSTTLIVQNI